MPQAHSAHQDKNVLTPVTIRIKIQLSTNNPQRLKAFFQNAGGQEIRWREHCLANAENEILKFTTKRSEDGAANDPICGPRLGSEIRRNCRFYINFLHTTQKIAIV